MQVLDREQEVAHDRAGQPAVGHGQPPPRDLRPHDPQHGDAAQAHPEQVQSVLMTIMVTMMMMDRFTTNLRYLELPCDLITREVLQELAGRWEHKR